MQVSELRDQARCNVMQAPAQLSIRKPEDFTAKHLNKTTGSCQSAAAVVSQDKHSTSATIEQVTSAHSVAL